MSNERRVRACAPPASGAATACSSPRATPPTTCCAWFALMEVGAIQVPVNPASSDAEVAGFVAQVEPALVVDDARAVVSLFAASTRRRRARPRSTSSDVAVMIPTSGTTGRSKLVMQTHLAYVMAGEGFPYWMQLTADDRLMTSLPLFHINAPAYSTLGSIAARASLVLLPGFSASRFIDAARRFGATEFNSIGAMLEILMRQPERPDDADNPMRLCYTGPVARAGTPGGDRSALRHRDRVRLRAVGVAVRADLAARHAAVRHARVGAPASAARSRQRRPRARRRRRDVGWAGSASWSCATRRSCAATTRCPRRPRPCSRRLAPHRRPRHRQRRRHVHVRRAQERGDPPPGREPFAGRGRGRARAPSRRRRSRGRSACRRTCRKRT